jgi:hypothetical protein
MPRTRSRAKAGLLTEPVKSRSYAQEVLSKSAIILVKTGHSPKELARTFRQICRTLEEPPHPFDPDAIPYLVGLSHIVAHWYSDPGYRDRRGEPLRVSLRGSGPCLANLIRRVFPRQDIEAVANALVRAGALQRRGRWYVPADRYVALTQDVSSVHGLASIVGMLRTVQHNISCADKQCRLLERAAGNLYIPVRALPEIHRRLKRDMTALLWKLDGYLRSWEVEPGSEPTTRIGIGAYAYEDPIITGSRPARRGAYASAGSRAARRARAPQHS